jgi:DNA repair exonuclease SbcCD ATPase subunit
MLELISLKFNNIGKHTTEQEINFSEHEKRVLIEGKSGSGKTTIFHALDYLLGINEIPSTKLQCRLTKIGMYAIGTFKINDELVTVKRSKKDGLTITTPSETVSGNVALAEEKLDQIIGVPRELFSKITHKQQKQPGFFLKMKNKEMYEFLIELLGLRPYQDKIEKISAQIALLEKDGESFIFKKDSLVKNIEELQNIMVAEQPPVKPDYTDEQIEVGKGKVIELTNELNEVKKNNAQKISTLNNNVLSIKTAKQKELSELGRPIKQSAIFDDTKLKELQIQVQTLKKQKDSLVNSFFTEQQKLKQTIDECKYNLRNIERYKTEATAIGQDIQKLRKESDHISKNTCPTCLQNWIGDSVTVKVNSINAQIQALISKALELKDKIVLEQNINNLLKESDDSLQRLTKPDTATTDSQIADLEKLLILEQSTRQNLEKTQENEYLKAYSIYQAQANNLNNKFDEQVRELEKEISVINYDPTINEIGNQISMINNATNEAIKAMNYYADALQNYQIRTDRNNKLIATKQTELNALIFQNEAQARKIVIAQETKRLIKSYTLQIFQETLDTIGENAGQILSKVHNTMGCSIYFEGCKETKTGTIKDEVNAIINMDGENEVPIDTLSGGQRTVVDLAVDLAVIDVIESKVGKGANFFVIDEPFDGLDSEGKEQILEMLSQLSSNKQIILVDHSPELKEMIRDVIKIV